jgi:hypothetical protein
MIPLVSCNRNAREVVYRSLIATAANTLWAAVVLVSDGGLWLFGSSRGVGFRAAGRRALSRMSQRNH